MGLLDLEKEQLIQYSRERSIEVKPSGKLGSDEVFNAQKRQIIGPLIEQRQEFPLPQDIHRCNKRKMRRW